MCVRAICDAFKQEIHGVSVGIRKFKEGGEREGGDGRYPILKNVGALMPAARSRCWRQNLKLVAQKNTNAFSRQRAMALHLRAPGAR
jgi:hypothetical protein